MPASIALSAGLHVLAPDFHIEMTGCATPSALASLYSLPVIEAALSINKFNDSRLFRILNLSVIFFPLNKVVKHH